MLQSEIVMGIDAASAGASVSSMALEAAGQSGALHDVAAGAGCDTIVHNGTPDDLPYRVDLGVPKSILREVPGKVLSEMRETVGVSLKDRESHWEPHGRAIQYLRRQLALHKRAPVMTCIVVPDDIEPESVDCLLGATRLGNHARVIPWPMAAVWGWIGKNGDQLQRPRGGKRMIAGSLLAVRIVRGGWQAVCVSLVWHPDRATDPFVPARDRDGESLLEGRWASESRPEPDPHELLDAIKRRYKGEGRRFCGVVVTGRVWPASWNDRLALDLAESTGVPSNMQASDISDSHGLLSRGAMKASELIALKRVPYYETLPRIEALARMMTWDPDSSLHMVPLPFWIDVLQGLQSDDDATIAGHRLLPANRELRHQPGIPDLKIELGQRAVLKVAFGGRSVRKIEADVDGSLGYTERVRLRVEYVLGSGRPRVTFERDKQPAKPIHFSWDRAVDEGQTRDKQSPLNQQEAEAEMQRRIALRKKRGFSV